MKIEQLAKFAGKTAAIALGMGLMGPIGIGSSVLISAIIGGTFCFDIAFNENELSKIKEENKKLKEELRKSNIDNATKQEIIKKLNEQIKKLNEALEKEKEKVETNEDTIKILKVQIDELYEILKEAKAA